MNVNIRQCPDQGPNKSPVGILSYPHLFTPQPGLNGGKEKFACVLVFPPEAQNTEAFKNLKNKARDAVRDRWGDKVPKGLRSPLRDVEDNDNMAAQFPAGSIYVNFKSDTKPGIVDPGYGGAQPNDIVDPVQVYPGQHARVSFSAYAYDVNGNRGVSFGLNNVQITVPDAPRIDGRKAASAEFGSAGSDDLSNSSSAPDDDEDIW